MKFPSKITEAFIIIYLFAFTGCRKNLTTYYTDPENEGIAAFTNKNFNIASAYVNGDAWRTVDRRSSGFLSSVRIFELNIRRQITNTNSDSLRIEWPGFYQKSNYSIPEITINVVFAIPKNFNYRNFAAFRGERFYLNMQNGYFSIEGTGFPQTLKGNGAIYFQSLTLDSTGLNIYTGKMSGLFEAQFQGALITKGRFDHELVPEVIQFN